MRILWQRCLESPSTQVYRNVTMITGSGDGWEPSQRSEEFDWDDRNEHRTTPSMQEKLLKALFQEYDADTKSYINVSDRLVVEQVEAYDYGGLNIHLSGNLRVSQWEKWRTLAAFPAGEQHFALRYARWKAY